jgi:hypothetical protein
MTTTAGKLRDCPFDVDLASDARPADDLHSRAAGYSWSYYRTKDEDPEAPERDLSDPEVRATMLATASAIVKLADDLMRDSVFRARETGASWEQIGRDLGMTKQAAWERFGKAAKR